MSEEGNTAEGGGEGSVETKKAKTEYTTVRMDDGREVKFAGKRKVNREVILHKDAEGKAHGVTVRFDFLNGKSHSIGSSDLNHETSLLLLGHGISQKVGDESAGVTSVDDMVLGSEEMIGRLKKGEFYSAARQPGDSFAGASVVIRAIVEATGKPVDWVKEFLNKKLEKAKAAGEKLSRRQLYDSFRDPASKTGPIIERMEKEERAKAAGSGVKAVDLLSAMEEGAEA